MTVDGRLLAFVAADGVVNLVSAKDGSHKARLPLSGGASIAAVNFDPVGRLLCAGTRGGRLFLWDLDSTDTPRTLGTENGAIGAIRFSPDSTRIAVGGPNGVTLWTLDGDNQRIDEYDGNGVKALAFTPDGRQLAVGGPDDSEIRLLDPMSGSSLAIFDTVDL